MNKIYDFNEFLNESQQRLPEDLMQQVVKYFNTNGDLWLDSEGRVCCDGDVFVKNKTIQKFPFQWGTVKGSFDCEECTRLTSLEGAPQKVEKVFSCHNCESLTSLKGAPQEVGGSFHCSYCPRLTSLEGAPQKVGSFYCNNCEILTSLKGAPQKVNQHFDCSRCVSLTSLEGAPREIKGGFLCYSCSELISLKGAPFTHDGLYYVRGCPKVPEEELALAEEQPELFKVWLKSGLDLEVWKKEKRGMVASKKFGF